jgi:hypothetical protein
MLANGTRPPDGIKGADVQGWFHTAFWRQAELSGHVDVAFVVASTGGLQSLDVDVLTVKLPWGATEQSS